MARPEDRGSDRNRRRSRFDREPSPKRFRRDRKLEIEKLPTNTELDKDQDQKHNRRFLDSLPLEAPLVKDSKFETGTVNKDSEDKTNEPRESIKHSSEPSKIPRSRSYFQHDDRGSAGQSGRSIGRRTDNEFGWWRDSKEHHQHGRAVERTVAIDAHHRGEKVRDYREDSRVWRHDGYFEIEAKSDPSVRKRPSFREQKIIADPEKNDKVAADPMMPNHKEHAESGRRDSRWHSSRRSDRHERPSTREREMNRAEGLSDSRDRYRGASNGYRGRERFTSYPPTGGRVENKWKHDLYNDANKSPTPKNEEDQISKIEALLSS